MADKIVESPSKAPPTAFSFAGLVAAPAKPARTTAEGEGEDDDGGAEGTDQTENVDFHIEPLVKLDAVSIPTGEENEECLLDIRAKLFRWGEGNLEIMQWKERGVGDLKLLRNNTTKLTRLLMRRDKTLKVCANHYLSEEMKLEGKLGSDKAWCYSVLCDFADAVPLPETLAFRFKDKETADAFKSQFDASRDENIKIKGGGAPASPAKTSAKDAAAEPAVAEAQQNPAPVVTAASAAADKAVDDATAQIEKLTT